jgi:hypothetical protein
MLTCHGDEVRLPQSDLAYVGFRLAVLDTLCQMDICQGLEDEEDVIFGYLMEVPFLAQVAPPSKWTCRPTSGDTTRIFHKRSL